LRDELDVVLRQNPFVSYLGGKLVDWGLGWAQVRLVSDPRLSNLVGTVHGGALTGLADAAFEIACNSYGRVCVAVDTACHYTQPGEIGTTLVAEAEEVSRSRNTASYRITVLPEGASSPTAWYMAACYRTDRWHLPAGRFPESWRQNY
jgi:acyl-CoA thioesterase